MWGRFHHGPRRVGAHPHGGNHRARRSRRRRRSDGAHRARHHLQARPDEAIDGGHQQGRRRRRRRLPRRQDRERQSAQTGHHAVEPVHHTARDRHSILLQGHHAGGDDGAGRVHPLGQRRQAVQDRQGIHRRRQGGERRVQDGRHRLQAGRPDHHRRAREADRRKVHLYSVQGRRRGCGPTGRQSRRFHRQQPDRSGGAVARRQASAAVRVRQQEARLQGKDRRRSRMGFDPDLQVGRHRCRVPDAARLLHGARRDAGPGELLRRPVEEGPRDRGVEEADERWRFQSELHDREGISRLGRQRGTAASGSDEGRRLPRPVTATIWSITAR